MSKIYDLILTPAVVNAIKKVEEGKGVQLLDLQWESQSFANKDREEICITVSSFAEGTAVTFKEPEIKNEEN